MGSRPRPGPMTRAWRRGSMERMGEARSFGEGLEVDVD